MKPLFVYGTLMFTRVLEKLIGEVELMDAVLEHYRRVKVIDRGNMLPYPALIPQEGARTEGKLLFGLSELQLLLLDEYEGDEYERIEVEANTKKGKDRAWCYVWKNEHVTDLGGDWDPKEFERLGLMDYLRTL